MATYDYAPQPESKGHREVPGSVRPYRPHWATMFTVWFGVFLLIWIFVSSRNDPQLLNPSAEARDVAPRGDLFPDELKRIQVFREASPSVVHITTSELARSLFSLDVFAIPRGTGSGIVYDDQGYIVTNYHVIEPGRNWTVRLADQSVWPAKLVGFAAEKDLAVLKIDVEKSQLRPIALGTSDDLQVGQDVLAIGNPFGLDQTLTTGVVSALGRDIPSPTGSGRRIRDVIQTDAAINPGNSGGPLLDSAGRLIGINTQIASPSGASAGVGFAVPVDVVNRIVPDLIRYGRVRRPALGIAYVPDAITRQIGIRTGVLIDTITEGGPAEQAGLRGTTVNRSRHITQLGDVIIAVNDIPTSTTFDLLDVLERFEIGDKVRITYIREDARRESEVTLGTNDSS